MRLHALLRGAGLSGLITPGLADPLILGVTEDSRQVANGFLFIARPGRVADGGRHVADAIARGAAVVLAANPPTEEAAQTPHYGVFNGGALNGGALNGGTLHEGALNGGAGHDGGLRGGGPHGGGQRGGDHHDRKPAFVLTDRPAGCASPLANAFYARPAERVKVLGITGTNGKTTTAYLLRHILNAAGHKCGMIGTVEVDDGATLAEATMTTPDAVSVARLLRAMADNGCRACAIETSSHALDQGRASGVGFAGAGFTNLTGDHLDYHKTMDAYAAAKARLFGLLSGDGVAVVNRDDPAGATMAAAAERAGRRVVTFSQRGKPSRAEPSTDDVIAADERHNDNAFGPAGGALETSLEAADHRAADYRAADVVVTAQGTHFILIAPDGRAEVASRLIGRHNVENMLCAAALAGEVFGLTARQIAAGLKDAPGAPGRLQAVTRGHGRQPFTVLVDYAHTDDALRNVLTALRPLTRGRLRVVFGCGGDRDATKRPRMAAVAEQLADELYLTSDNPRTEDPQAILDQMLAGLSGKARPRVRVEPNRGAAIYAALTDAHPGDVVLIAGKGHENYQIIGTQKHPFDDVEHATAALERVSA